MYQPTSPALDRVKLRQDERIGEKDRVVEERLRRHQRQPDKGSHAVAVEQRVEHFAQAACGSRERRRMAASGGDRLEITPPRMKPLLDPRDDRLALRLPPVDREPARTFGNPHAHEKDDQAEQRAGQEGEPPSELRD